MESWQSLVNCNSLLNCRRKRHVGSNPSLSVTWKVNPIAGDGNCLENSRGVKALVSSTLTPSVNNVSTHRCNIDVTEEGQDITA